MKPLASALASLTVILAASAQDSPLRFDNDTIDIGNVRADIGECTVKFPFTNVADTAVSILGASATCGCAIPKYPRQPVAPGSRDTVSVILRAGGLPPGPIFKKIRVYCAGLANPVVLYLRAKSVFGFKSN